MTAWRADRSGSGDAQSQLLARLGRFRSGVRLVLLARGAAAVVGVMAGMLVVGFVLDRWLRLPVLPRMVLLALMAAVAGRVAYGRLLRPLLLRLDAVDLAWAIDRARGGGAREAISPRVAAVLQLARQAEETGVSRYMVREALARDAAALAGVDFSRYLDRRRALAAAGLLAAIATLGILWALIFPQTAGLCARRWFAASNEPWPQATYLIVEGLADGRLVVPRGEPLSLRVTAKAGSVVPAGVTIRYGAVDGGGRLTSAMTRAGLHDFRLDLGPVAEPISVRLWGGDDDVGPFAVTPVDRPRIEKLTLTARHPTDAAAVTRNFSGDEADWSFLQETDLTLHVTSSRPLSGAHLIGSGPAIPTLERLSDTEYEARWTHRQTLRLAIELVSREAGLSSHPTPVVIGLKKDLPPRVELAVEDVGPGITPMAVIPVTLRAQDDFGVAGLAVETLVASVTGAVSSAPSGTQPAGRVVRLPALVGMEKHVDRDAVVKVADLGAQPGGAVQVVGLATDNCYQAPQTGRSSPRVFQVVASDELFREILLSLQRDRALLRQAQADAQDVADQLAVLKDTAQAQALGRKHRLIQRQIWTIGRDVKQAAFRMKVNGLGSPEALAILDENVSIPLADLHDGLMTGQRERLDRLGQGLDAALVSAAAADQQQTVERIKRVLARMAEWDSFVDVLNQLDEVLRLEYRVRDGTGKLRDKAVESIFNEPAPPDNPPNVPPATRPAPAEPPAATQPARRPPRPPGR